MHKSLALCLLLLATPVVADSDVTAVPPVAEQPAASASQPAPTLPVVPAPQLPETPESGWADRAASMISIFAGVTTVLLLIWKTISNRARVRREQQGED